MAIAMQLPINIAYVVAPIFFIAGLKLLRKPNTARLGNLISAIAMLLAVIATLLEKDIVNYQWIIVGIIIGGTIGALLARLVVMTAMPQLVALFNGFGGAASLLVGYSQFYITDHTREAISIDIAILAAIIVGGVTFSGSIVAYGKLAAIIKNNWRIPLQQIINILLLIILCIAIWLFFHENYIFMQHIVLFCLCSITLIIGITLVMPIGGADMPVVISLLNSYSGIAAAAAGFVLQNTLLIIAGMLVGASGLVLTKVMCSAMNRSLVNVIFKGLSSQHASKIRDAIQGEAKPIQLDDAFMVLEAASTVIIVPGYGLAVAQAQHAVKELASLLENNGAEVKYAIHPVAGRMPGHMNVLLAEANVPYEQLLGPDDVNSLMPTIDVCMVIGANDVVNPLARDEQNSPLYGMPIIEVDKARTVLILKRSMNPGFAGVDNPLFFKENARMLFGDAKELASSLATEFKSS